MDDEITGMFQVAKVLEGLDEEARARVVRWAADKFGVDLGQPLEAEEEAPSPDQTMFLGVDPEKVAAAKESREKESDSTPQLLVQPASSLDDAADAPPQRDPDKPSFMDTSFRMFSGKQELKKQKKE